MLKAHLSPAMRNRRINAVTVAAIAVGASFAVPDAAHASAIAGETSLAPELPAWLADGALVVLLGLCAAAAFLIHRLRRRNRLMSAALDNMPQGLAMLDSSARLMLCNAR